MQGVESSNDEASCRVGGLGNRNQLVSKIQLLVMGLPFYLRRTRVPGTR